MGLQNDIFNNLKNQKFYLEKDLIEILTGQIMFSTYKEKEDRIASLLKEIATIATAFSLVEIYIKEDNKIDDNGISE